MSCKVIQEKKGAISKKMKKQKIDAIEIKHIRYYK